MITLIIPIISESIRSRGFRSERARRIDGGDNEKVLASTSASSSLELHSLHTIQTLTNFTNFTNFTNR